MPNVKSQEVPYSLLYCEKEKIRSLVMSYISFNVKLKVIYSAALLLLTEPVVVSNRQQTTCERLLLYHHPSTIDDLLPTHHGAKKPRCSNQYNIK